MILLALTMCFPHSIQNENFQSVTFPLKLRFKANSSPLSLLSSSKSIKMNGTNEEFQSQLKGSFFLGLGACSIYSISSDSSSFPTSFFFCLQEINYDSPRGGVSVITEKGEMTTSYLLIQRARTTDSGKYVCSPSNADPSTINVHILNGTVRPPYSLTASRAMTNTTVFARYWQHFRQYLSRLPLCECFFK